MLCSLAETYRKYFANTHFFWSGGLKLSKHHTAKAAFFYNEFVKSDSTMRVTLFLLALCPMTWLGKGKELFFYIYPIIPLLSVKNPNGAYGKSSLCTKNQVCSISKMTKVTFHPSSYFQEKGFSFTYVLE